MLITQEIALRVATEFELAAQNTGYFHVALGGSCLYDGESRKDIDLIIYPRDMELEADRVKSLLKSFGVEFDVTEDDIKAASSNKNKNCSFAEILIGHWEISPTNWVRIDFILTNKVSQ